MKLRAHYLPLGLTVLALLSACTPVRTAGNVAIGAGQVVLTGADLLI